MTTQIETTVCSLAAPQFAEFFERLVSDGFTPDQLNHVVQKPDRWTPEFVAFLCETNVPAIKQSQSISDWLQDVTCAIVDRSAGGSFERPIEYRDIQLGPENGKAGNLVADFSEYDVSDWDQPDLVTGARYRFSVSAYPANDLLAIEATAHVESRYGRMIVVFELEARS